MRKLWIIVLCLFAITANATDNVLGEWGVGSWGAVVDGNRVWSYGGAVPSAEIQPALWFVMTGSDTNGLGGLGLAITNSGTEGSSTLLDSRFEGNGLPVGVTLYNGGYCYRYSIAYSQGNSTNVGAVLATSSNITFSCWVNPQGGVNGNEGLMATYVGANQQPEAGLLLDGNVNIKFRINQQPGTEDVAGTLDASYAVWQHLAGTYDGANLVLYIDGEPVATNAYATALDFSGLHLYIGNYYNVGSLNYDGLLDDARVYTNTLSHGEIHTNLFRNHATQHNYVPWQTNNWDDTLNTNCVLACNFDFTGTVAVATAQDTSNKGQNDNNSAFLGGAGEPARGAGFVTFASGDSMAATVTETKDSFAWWGNTNTWIHYANLGGTQYVNGVEQAFDNVFYVVTGNIITNGLGTDGFHAHSLDEFYVWDYTPDPADVWSITNGGNF